MIDIPRYYHLLAETMVDLIGELDLRGNFIYASPSHERVLGWSAEYLLGRNVDELLHPEEREQFWQHLPLLLKSGQQQADFRCRKADGSYLWLEGMARLQSDSAGVPQSMVLSCRDITVRKEAELALQASEERYRTLIENLPELICVITPAGRYTYWNQYAYQKLGYTPEEVLGQLTVTDINAPDSETEVAMSTFEDGAPKSRRVKLIRKDGTLLPVEATVLPLCDKAGRIHSLVGIARDISERVRAEQALKTSEDQFREAFEHAGIGMAVVGGNGRWIKVNQAFCAAVGYSEAELLATTFQAITHPDDLANCETMAERLWRGDIETYEIEKRYLHKNGSIVWVQLNVSLVRDAEGAPLYFVDQIQDITARKQAQLDLQDRELRYQMMADHAPFVMSAIDHTGHYVVWNRFAEQLIGYTAAEARALTPRDLTDDSQLLHEVGQLLRQGGTIARDIRLRHKDGHPVDIHLVLVPYRDAAGEIETLYGFAEDLTARRRVEEQQRQLYAAIEQNSEIVFITTANGRIMYANPAFTQVTGIPLEEALGATPRIMRSGLHDAAFYSEMWNTITAGQVWRGRIVNRKRNGELYEQFSTIAPVRDEQGTITHFVAVQLDLSREVALEKQLRQAERLTAIGQTITGVAHHLKNILTRLEGSAAQITEHFEHRQFDELMGLWGIYQRSTERLSSLARTMLDYARLDKLALESIEIGSLVRDICEQCAPGAHARGVAVHWKIPADLPPLVCDPLRMHDAILNLIDNAIDVCGEVGLGCVQIRVCHDGPARVLRIEIEDDGPGVPEDLQSRIFDPFFTTKADGTGLGLAMARKIVMEHGGLLELDSLPGRTCFRVTFSL